MGHEDMEPTTPEKKLELLQCQRDQLIPLIKDLDRQIDYLVSERDEARKSLQEIEEKIKAINKQMKPRGKPGKPAPTKPRRRSRNRPPRFEQADGDKESAPVDDSAPASAAPATPENCVCSSSSSFFRCCCLSYVCMFCLTEVCIQGACR